MSDSNPQLEEFKLVTGAISYRSRSDPTATNQNYLVSGSQNVLINEATDDGGDKVETRPGYELFGTTSEDLNGIVSDFKFKTKAGNTIIGRMDSNGDLEYYSEQSDAWETLLTGLDGSYKLRWSTAWNSTELLRVLLFVNHSSTLYSWSGAFSTFVSSTPTTIVIASTVATAGFFITGTRSIRVKDTGGTWRTFTVTGQSGSTFTVTEDPTAFTFNTSSIVVQAVRTTVTTPASGFINDTIAVMNNHIFIGSHSSSVVYMSKSTDYTIFTFSSPRVPTEGWQFLLDDFNIGFQINITTDKQESLVMFAGSDWIYRTDFNQIGDTAVVETVTVRPFFVADGQGAISQELITKIGNTIVFINGYKELVDLGSIENYQNIQQTPISDPIRPDFINSNFTGGGMKFIRNNLYVSAPNSTVPTMFILSFRQGADGATRRFWQPPQVLSISALNEYNQEIIGHSSVKTESYNLFKGTNDNGQAIAFKAHFAYRNYGARDKKKVFDKHFSELYLTANTSITVKLIYEFLASKELKEYVIDGSVVDYIFTPNPLASLGVIALGTSPLGGSLIEPENFRKYRRFKPIVSKPDFFELQERYESDALDDQWQLVSHGTNAVISVNSPVKLIS